MNKIQQQNPVKYTIYFKSDLRGMEEVRSGVTDNLEYLTQTLEHYRNNEPTEIEGQYIAVIE